jgi:nicotinamide riboside kinase
MKAPLPPSLSTPVPPPIKICVTGTFSSGKTTFAKALAQKLGTAILLPELARELKESVPSINFSQPHVRGYLLIEQLLRERRAEQQPTDFLVVESGVPSACAHDTLLGHAVPAAEVLRACEHRAYDLIFLCSYREVPLEKDGIRYEDQPLRHQLHELLIQQLREQQFVHELTGTVEQRLGTALKVIAGRKSPFPGQL